LPIACTASCALTHRNNKDGDLFEGAFAAQLIQLLLRRLPAVLLAW
jgi:hypothetical protein